MNTILKVLVGSRAHGLATETSDYDYRAVFVVPTADLLSITRPKPAQTSWIEGQADQPNGKADATAWEVGHFLALALHCNPTILEVFAAPMRESTLDGVALRSLFGSVWDPARVRDAFIGYGLNQRKKFLEDKDTRPAKYASAYLRVLYQASVLLESGQLPVDLRDTPVFPILQRWREGLFTKGEVIDQCLAWQNAVERCYEKCRHVPNPAAVDAFLLDLRRRHW
jgi:predicted nucleotidyltransferase